MKRNNAIYPIERKRYILIVVEKKNF